jgi:hypothetical protein
MKSDDSFSFKNKKKLIRHAICKVCHALYRKKHYAVNKKKYISKALRWNKKQGQVLRKFLYSILLDSYCLDCGETDVLVLEFDHRRDKRFDISQMYKRRYSLTTIEKELEKCDVLCANCHRRKTAKEGGFWKYSMSQEIH